MSKISTNSGSVPMRKEPNYLYLVISLLIAVVLITSAPPLKPLGILGVFTGALSLMATAYIVTERRLHVLLAAVLGAAALYHLRGSAFTRGHLPPAWRMASMPRTLSSG